MHKYDIRTILRMYIERTYHLPVGHPLCEGGRVLLHRRLRRCEGGVEVAQHDPFREQIIGHVYTQRATGRREEWTRFCCRGSPKRVAVCICTLLLISPIYSSTVGCCGPIAKAVRLTQNTQQESYVICRYSERFDFLAVGCT